MPWPSDFEYILGGVDIAIFNVATGRTDMRTDRKRFLDDLTTPGALLRGVAGVHSDDLVPSTCSLGSENVEERAPGGVHDTFCEMVVLHHAIDVQLLDGNMMILLSVALGNFIVEVPPLSLDLEMGLCGATGSFSAAMTALLAAGYCPLLAPEGLLALPIVARIFNRMALRVSQEALQAYIDANIRMLTCTWGMVGRWLRLTDNQSVPMSVSTQDKMGSFRGSVYRTVQLDFDGTPKFLGNRKMLPIRGKLEVRFVLSQLDRVPSIRLLETGEASVLAQFAHSKEAFECLLQTICQHLNGGSRHMLTAATTEPGSQIVFHEEFARLLIVLCGGGQHFIVDMPRLDQASHECSGLGFIWVEAVLKRSHAAYFTASRLNCQVGTWPAPLPQGTPFHLRS